MSFLNLVKVIGCIGVIGFTYVPDSLAETPLRFKLDPVLIAKAEQATPELIEVLVTFKNMPGSEEINFIEGLGGEIYRSYGRMPMQAIRIPTYALSVLANSRMIESVSTDRVITQSRLIANATVK